jgi:hypothetical protein
LPKGRDPCSHQHITAKSIAIAVREKTEVGFLKFSYRA